MNATKNVKTGVKCRDSSRWKTATARETRANNLNEHRKTCRTHLFMNNRQNLNNAGRKSPAVLQVKDTMVKHSELYKSKGRKFENGNLNRYIQSKNLQDERKDKRNQLFLRNRNVAIETKIIEKPATVATPKGTAKMAKLQSAKKAKSSLENRPPFVVGIVHYPLCPIPPLNINLPRTCRQPAARTEEKVKKISKATEKRLAARSNKADSENVALASANGKTPRSKRVCKSVVKNAQVELKEKKEVNRTEVKEEVKSKVVGQEQKQEEENYKETEGDKMELSTDVRIKPEPASIEKTSNSSVESVHLEMSTESCKNSAPEDVEPTFISPFVVCNRGKENARNEQKSQLSLSSSSPDDVPTKDTVMGKLNISVKDEEKTAQYLIHLLKKEEGRLKGLCVLWEREMNVPKNVKQKIETVIEDTRVLINKKFDWFLSLANNCKHGNGKELVASKDLLCFWEMVREEIYEIDKGFELLTKLKSHDWRTSPEFEESLLGNVDRLTADRFPPKFTSTPKAQLNRSLLEGLNLLTLKAPEIELDMSISYINSEQTPARGILKKAEDGSSSGEKGNKSVQKVNFNDTVLETPIPNVERQEFELSRAEGQNLNLESVRVDRKLIFDESDLPGFRGKSIFTELMEAQNQNSDLSKNQEEVVKLQKTFDVVSDDDDIVVRSLRNRTVLLSNKRKSRSEHLVKSADTRRKKHLNSEDAENSSTPTKTKSSRKTITFATSHNHGDELVVSGKRSIRKSIKFNEDGCTACTPQKRQQKSATPRKTGSVKKIRF